MRRVVITGMGIWSCLGTDLETVKESLYQGKSGIGLDEGRLTYGYRSGLMGIVETPVITNRLRSLTITCVITRWAASLATTHRQSP